MWEYFVYLPKKTELIAKVILNYSFNFVIIQYSFNKHLLNFRVIRHTTMFHSDEKDKIVLKEIQIKAGD